MKKNILDCIFFHLGKIVAKRWPNPLFAGIAKALDEEDATLSQQPIEIQRKVAIARRAANPKNG
jgi:hypothetical protein